MNFEDRLTEGRVKRVLPNKLRASSLFKSSAQAIDTAKLIRLDQGALKSILR